MDAETEIEISIPAGQGTPADVSRQVVHRTRGHEPARPPEGRIPECAARRYSSEHGPIRRMVSPADLGQRIKPFVFLDYAKVKAQNAPRFGLHPHSGIATLTFTLEGEGFYEETTGKKGVLAAGDIEWMDLSAKAGSESRIESRKSGELQCSIHRSIPRPFGQPPPPPPLPPIPCVASSIALGAVRTAP